MLPAQTLRIQEQTSTSLRNRPRLGFVGLGWIGRQRMQSLLELDIAEIALLADADVRTLQSAADLVPGASCATCFEKALAADLDGLVIATPSALHADQTMAALRRGLAVFCQKPLARTAAETARIVDTARRTDRLLGVDFSYRALRGVDQLRDLVQGDALGRVFAVDLTFHNAYGPDKEWFRDFRRSGGGCVIDLGIHLIDLAHWVLDERAVCDVRSTLWKQAELIRGAPEVVEDYALAEWHYAGGTAARLSCSWNLSAGQDAVIEAAFYGNRGAAVLRNINGSFYDFTVEHHVGTQRTLLSEPPDAWGGRALARWVNRLSVSGNAFDPETLHLVDVAKLVDRIYRR